MFILSLLNFINLNNDLTTSNTKFSSYRSNRWKWNQQIILATSSGLSVTFKNIPFDCGIALVSIRTDGYNEGCTIVLSVSYYTKIIAINTHNDMGPATVGGNVSSGINVSITSGVTANRQYKCSIAYMNWNANISNET